MSLKVKAAKLVTPSLPNVPEPALSVPFVEGTAAESSSSIACGPKAIRRIAKPPHEDGRASHFACGPRLRRATRLHAHQRTIRDLRQAEADRDQSVGVFGRIDEAIAEAKRLAALDEPAKARGEKKYDGDAEAFAGMKRARENGFAPHEPALKHAELHQLNAAASTMDRACELAYEAMTHEIEAFPLAALHAGMMRALDEQRETQTGFYGPATDFAPGLAPKIVITVNDVEIKGEVLSGPIARSAASDFVSSIARARVTSRSCQHDSDDPSK